MISILLPVYNGEKYIRYAIDSVLKQTFSDFELLVGFNGTTDNSKKIVSEIVDSRIKVFDYGTDKGKSKTLNKLLKEAKYDYVCLQDDDDIWNERKLLSQLEFLRDFDVVGTQISYMDKNGSIIGKPLLKCKHEDIVYFSLKGENQLANSSTIFKKSCIIEANGWDESLPALEDYDLWLRLMKKGKKFLNLNDYLVDHRIHDESNFNTNSWIDIYRKILSR
jgi:glycosyltransferase involved in cell wall biosynthesis